MLDLKFTSQFKKDMRRLRRQGASIEKIDAVIKTLREEEPLPERMHDHALAGNYRGHRECHVEPDWLLIYRFFAVSVCWPAVLPGAHSDLFGL